MASNQSFPAFRVGFYTVFIMLLLFCIGGVDCKGTTKGFKKIILGRCYEYLDKYLPLGLVESPPAAGRESVYCEHILDILLKAFAFKDACTVTAKHYEPFFEATGKAPIKDKILFWSKHKDLSLKMSNHGQRFIVLADTLPGYLVTGLNWCGEVRGSYNPPNEDGINFHECPICKKDPVKDKDKEEHFAVFWGIASATFAKKAQGVIHHLVNGALPKPYVAYDDQTFFHKHELPNIDKTKVTEFRLIVANEPGKTVREKCGTGTINTLQDLIKTTLGKDAACVVNPLMVIHLMCADKPNTPECLYELIQAWKSRNASKMYPKL